ncbi:uncharacterized protein LOC105630131 isoform X4 [Jatropha curcas]|uniref:uncharacterized protein LOC105630131 isoform X4 n=1 Tax=Jatropha curcas TaxID=180498 RepID=UPI0009D66CA1|nr:uncharacterized protein LOC105630131 isoform X4 [Jatropha curcas]
MDFDLDPFEDILNQPSSVHAARAGGKFQPKAKPRPKKGTSSSRSSTLPSNAKDVSSFSTTLDTTKSVRSIDTVDDGLTSPVDSSLVSPALIETKEHLENDKGNLKFKPVNSSGSLVTAREYIASPDVVPSEIVVSSSNNNEDSMLLIKELDLDSLACIASDTASKESVGYESQPKAELQPTDETFTSVSLKIPDGSNNKSESLQLVDVADDGYREPVSLSLTTTFVDGEPLKDFDGSSSHEKGSLEATNLLLARMENVGSMDALDSEATRFDGNGNWNSSFVKSVEDVGSLEFDLDPSNIMLPGAINSRADEKFQPKPNAKTESKNEIPVPFPPLPSNLTMEQPAALALVDTHTTQSVQSVDFMDKNMDPVSSSLPLDIDRKEPLKDDEFLFPDDNLELVNPSSKEPAHKQDISSKDAKLAEVRSKSYGPGHSSFLESAIEVDSMMLDLDPFADIVPPPAIGNARTGGKFQPRVKARPRKGKSEAIALAVSSTNASDNLQSANFVDTGDDRLIDPVHSSLTTLENMESKEPLRIDDYSNPGVYLSNEDRSSGLANSSQLVAIDSLHTGASNKETEGQSGSLVPSSVNSSVPGACDVANLDAVTCNEAAVQTNNERPEPEFQESGSFPNLENPDILTDSTIVSEHSTRKFQPKLKEQIGKEKPTVSIFPPDALESAVPTSDSHFVPSVPLYINEGSIPSYPSDDVFDYSSMSFGNFVSPDPTFSEFPVNEEQTNLTEASHSSDRNLLHQEDLPEVPEMESSKSRKRKSSSVSNTSQTFKQSSLASGMNESEESSKRLRKRTASMQLVDSSGDEAHDSDGFPSEPPSNSNADGEDNDYDYRVDEDNGNGDGGENTSCKKRTSKRSKKPVGERTKPVRRRKTDNDVPEQTQKPRKKFSHSTRRKSRLKDLLSIPEDEVDYQRMPFKDIILLAGYKEKLAAQEAKEAKDAAAKAKASKDALASEREGSHNEEDTEQDGGYADDQSNSLFNYHSFMDKTPIARWSKQDTELFYEGIRQFGTDLSLIQQLFPGRTRHQIKLKYKKEERQHPLRLSEALNTRAKDNSYFEKVIEQLQQVAAQAEQESNGDDMIGPTDEETELNPETNEEAEAAKCEWDEEAAVEEDQGDAGDPSKYEQEEDDDLDLWIAFCLASVDNISI